MDRAGRWRLRSCFQIGRSTGERVDPGLLQCGTTDRRIGLAIANFGRASVPGEMTKLEMVRISAIGTKRTSPIYRRISAFGEDLEMRILMGYWQLR
jgi:hypothetical protein